MTSTFMHKQRHIGHGLNSEDVQAIIESQEEEIAALREQLKGLKNLYKLAKEKNDHKVVPLSSASHKNNELLADFLYQKQRVEKLTQVVAEKEKEMCELQNEKTLAIVKLEEALHIAKQREELLNTASSKLEEAERKIAALEKERSLFQEGVFRTQSAKEDAEARLKVAHFHLAKKVKETAYLSDLSENLKIQTHELIADLENSQQKIEDLQKLLEEQLDSENRLKDQFQESLKESTALANAWEKKYIVILEKWQENEKRFNEMKTLEERLQKLHSQWINMGFHFDGTDWTNPSKSGSSDHHRN